MCEVVFFTFEQLTEAPSSSQRLRKMYGSSRLSSCCCGNIECVGGLLHYSNFFYFSPFQVG